MADRARSDRPRTRGARPGGPVLVRRIDSGVAPPPSGADVVAATGSPRGVTVHPSALCESDHIGRGTRIWAFAHVLPGARIGVDANLCDHTFIESGATLGDRVTVKNGVAVWDGVTLEDDVFVGPNVAFTNDRVPRARPYRTDPADFLPTTVRRGAALGANATIVCGVTIGRYALVGAGAIVTRDVPDFGLVTGGPARLVGWICVCGGRLGESLHCGSCGRVYRRSSSGERIDLWEVSPGAF